MASAAVNPTPAQVVVEVSARLTYVVQPVGCTHTFCRKRVVTRRSQPTLIYTDSNVKESTIIKLSEMGID